MHKKGIWKVLEWKLANTKSTPFRLPGNSHEAQKFINSENDALTNPALLLPHLAPAENLASSSLQDGVTEWHYSLAWTTHPQISFFCKCSAVSPPQQSMCGRVCWKIKKYKIYLWLLIFYCSMLYRNRKNMIFLISRFFSLGGDGLKISLTP